MRTNYRYSRPASLDIIKRPNLKVAVVIACRDGQDKLDLVLAALKEQTYPAALFTVYIIDDGSEKALVLPKIRPLKTKIIKFKNKDQAWGKTLATNYAVSTLKEDVLWFLDADMIVEPHHLAHNMKWHHYADDFVVLGWKRFVAEWSYSPELLTSELKAGAFASLHKTSEGKESWELLIKGTDELRKPGLESFRALVGATFSITRKNWNSLGGYNPVFTTGEDNELGWRALLAGLRFVPEREALSWHLGISTVEVHTDAVIAHNRPLFANHVPALSYLRANDQLTWAVAENYVVADCRNMPAESFKNMVNEFFADEKGQARFLLIGNWKALSTRYKVTGDSLKELREIKRWIAGDSRFTCEEAASEKKLLISEILERFNEPSTPFFYYTEGAIDPVVRFGALRHRISKSGNGLEGVVDSKDQRTLIVYAPALGRANRAGGYAYRNIQELWGMRWHEISQFDFSKTLSSNNLIPLVGIAIRAAKRIRKPSDFTKLVKKTVHVLKKTISK
jgi:cellulose synthase/poly-beta-1,6-N-acetylglucosamine synthase-like glycosyltransferase